MGISAYCFSFVLSLQTSNTVSNCTFGGPVTYHDINTVPGLSLHVESHCLHTNEGTSQQIYSFLQMQMLVIVKLAIIQQSIHQ